MRLALSAVALVAFGWGLALLGLMLTSGSASYAPACLALFALAAGLWLWADPSWPARKVIMGCDARGDGKSPYLTRFYLLKSRRLVDDKPAWEVYLHRFHRSDADDLHDHPWGFVSVILWRGYTEVVRDVDGLAVAELLYDCGGCAKPDPRAWDRPRRQWPGMILVRAAEHVHRVQLVKGREAWSLVIRGPYVRQWGFHTPAGWERWQAYFARNRC